MRIKEGLTFDDVLLLPQHSKITSRSNIDLSVDLGKGIKLKYPFVSANMKNITESYMAYAVASFGGLAILHRFASIDDQIEMFNKTLATLLDSLGEQGSSFVGFSVGVGKQDYENVHRLVEAGGKIICVDVAHGDHELATNMTGYIAKKYPNVLLIAGNVATAGGARRLHEAGADVIKVGIGGGCFAAGTRVLMANGAYKNIEEIKPGDRIINKNGKSKTVKASFCTGVKKVLKIRSSLFYKPTFVTPDHRYWVGDLNSVSKATLQGSSYVKILGKESKTTPKQSKIKWKEVAELNQDCLLMPQNIDFEIENDFTINIRKRYSGNNHENFVYKKDVVLKPNYDLGFIFGTFLGDGHAMEAKHQGSNIGAVTWYFNKHEKDLALKLEQCIKRSFDKEISIKEEKSIIKCSFYYKPFSNFLSQFRKKDEKHLPSKYIVNNKSYLKGILDGLVASDGHIEKDGRVRFSNTSHFLIELFNVVNYLVNGYFSSNEKPRWPTSGGLKNVDNKNCKPGLVASNMLSQEKRLTGEYQINKLLDKEVVFLEVPVYDLTIDCETHSFIANNAIVHNSLCTTRIETGNGVPQMTALIDVFEQADICKFANKSREFKIIADGGIRQAGDCVKALCFSDTVMLGSLLAGTDEAPGDVEVDAITGQRFKMYAGSSTHKANRVEGVVRRVPCRGPVKPILQKLSEGIQSGLSYQGCSNLEELKDNPEFVRISNAGLVESHPHTY